MYPAKPCVTESSEKAVGILLLLPTVTVFLSKSLNKNCKKVSLLLKYKHRLINTWINTSGKGLKHYSVPVGCAGLPRTSVIDFLSLFRKIPTDFYVSLA